jgi:hypothetical protein
MSNDTSLPQTQSLEQNIINTCNLVTSMMNADIVNQQTLTGVTSIVNQILKSDTYIASIRSQVKTIIVDGVFDQKDLPAILTIVLESKAFLRTTLATGATIATNLDMGVMKYVVYAIIHFVMCLENTNSVSIASFDSTFSPLWNLVAFNPQELASDVSTISHKCFPCFYKK